MPCFISNTCADLGRGWTLGKLKFIKFVYNIIIIFLNWQHNYQSIPLPPRKLFLIHGCFIYIIHLFFLNYALYKNWGKIICHSIKELELKANIYYNTLINKENLYYINICNIFHFFQSISMHGQWKWMWRTWTQSPKLVQNKIGN